MRVLVACECSGAVRRAFRALGHDAWSCDIQPADDGDPHHIQGNVISHSIVAEREWDMLIAFPDCTYLTVAGAKWMAIPWRAAAQEWALAFVKTLWALPIPMKAIENPVGRLSTLWRRPDQIIQPWQFGHEEMKTTCLWLQNLPPLWPTKMVGPPPAKGTEERKAWERVWRMPPKGWSGNSTRGKERSVTYQGVAEAMAEQWGALELQSAA